MLLLRRTAAAFHSHRTLWRQFATQYNVNSHKLPHVPVMLQESVGFLLQKQTSSVTRTFIDATFGAGGYSRYMLQLDPKCRVIGIDLDPNVAPFARELRQTFGPERLLLARGNFGDVLSTLSGYQTKDSYFELDILDEPDIKSAQQLLSNGIAGIVFDLGVSSMQLDQPYRGFSYKLKHNKGQNTESEVSYPLDMRMDAGSSEGSVSAADLVNNCSEYELVRIITVYGEEPMYAAKKIARAIVQQRYSELITTTQQLARVVRQALGFGEHGMRKVKTSVSESYQSYLRDPCARTFQALRIECNGELHALERALKASYQLLMRHGGTYGGRLSVVTYHSLEDRIVKDFYRSVCSRVSSTKQQKELLPLAIPEDILLPSPEEVQYNKRARSAKLRRITFPAATV